MNDFEQLSIEVCAARSTLVVLGDADIARVKQLAGQSPRRRSRICMHRDAADPLHEMLIAIAAGSYIQPHRHVAKSESFHLVEGQGTVVLFDDNGTITDTIRLGARGSGLACYYRLADSRFHTLLVQGEMLVIHEVTNGPLALERTIMAPFAPAESDATAADAYLAQLCRAAAAFGRS